MMENMKESSVFTMTDEQLYYLQEGHNDLLFY